MSTNNEFIGEIELIFATLLFGISFVVQRFAMNFEISPITFNALRYGISTLLFYVFQSVLRNYQMHTDDKTKDDNSEHVRRHGGNHSMLVWVLIAGLSSFGGAWCTQESLVTLSAGKSGFITGSYVVVIPFIEWLLPAFFGFSIECVSAKIWFGAIMCIVGMFFMTGCGTDPSCVEGGSATGELFAMVGVLFWAVNIYSFGLAGHQVDSVDFLILHSLLAFVVSVGFAVVSQPEEWTYPFTNIRAAFWLSMFVGVMNAFAYFLSNVGQLSVRPSRAAIIYSAGESLTACIGGFIFLGESMTPIELFGGLLMLTAACISSTASTEDELATTEDGDDGAEGGEGAGGHVDIEGKGERGRLKDGIDDSSHHTGSSTGAGAGAGVSSLFGRKETEMVLTKGAESSLLGPKRSDYGSRE